jgi:hypothetical protein
MYTLRFPGLLIGLYAGFSQVMDIGVTLSFVLDIRSAPCLLLVIRRALSQQREMCSARSQHLGNLRSTHHLLAT